MNFFKKKENEYKSHNNVFKNILRVFNIIILSFLMIFFAIGGIFATTFVDIIKESPVIDASRMNELMSQSSTILDRDEELVEKIESEETRTIVDLDVIPNHLIDAFISIEDARFYSHKGVDPIGITKSLIEAASGKSLRGGSTIAQQLARNMYLSNERKLERKLKEAYLAIKITDAIGREKVMEAYLNRVFLGQHSYGVQAASQNYFSKDVGELTIAESALLASIVQSPTNFSLYKTIKPEHLPEDATVLSDLTISGQVYKAVYNPKVLDRQKYVLKRMYDLKKITKDQYEDAINEDISQAIKPNRGTESPVSTYFTELVKSQVVEKLIEKYGYTREEAWTKLINGGLTIHSTMDKRIQKNIENLFENFNTVLNAPKHGKSPSYVSWSRDDNNNILSESNNVIYFAKKNLLNSDNQIIIDKNSFTINEDKSISIKSPKISVYNEVLSISSFYTVNNDNNLVTHQIGNFSLPEERVKVENPRSFTLDSRLFEEYEDFYKIDDNGNLLLNSKYFEIDEVGTLQPQSSTVVIEQSTGQIIAIVGGRETKGRPLNRAFRTPRQPGSTIKPIAVYAPALENGYTAATPIDDVPHYNEKKELWPKNWYNGYRGIQSFRDSLVQSINVNAVKVLEDIGIEKSKEYLGKFGIINTKNELSDTFITKSENVDHNDENLASMALGSLTDGVTNLKMTAAFATIANYGNYKEPISFTKVVDSTGKVILESVQHEEQVISKENAFIMISILSDVPKVLVKNTLHPTIATAGKTGTTSDVQDSWFIGFSPYYTIGTWVGFDNPNIKISQDINLASTMWGRINKIVLQEKEAKQFELETENIIQVWVSKKSGKLATGKSSNNINEFFVKGTEPKEYDNSFITVKIDKRNGKLAHDRTPAQYIELRTYFVRPIPYNPAEHGGIIPQDYGQYPPTEVSELVEDEPVIPDPNTSTEPNNQDSNSNATEPNKPVDPNKPAEPNKPNKPR